MAGENFCKPARVFEWVKGNKKDGEAKTKSKWVEKHYGNVNLSDNKLSTSDEPSLLNHDIQSSMNLKPAFNCERAWIYRLKSDDGSETTYALRFKSKELAVDFQSNFLASVEAVKSKEAEAAKEAESEPVQENKEAVVEAAAVPVAVAQEEMDTTEEAKKEEEVTTESPKEEKTEEKTEETPAEEEKKEEEVAAPVEEEKKEEARRPC